MVKYKHGDLVQLAKLIRKYLKEIALEHPEYTPTTLAFSVFGALLRESDGKVDGNLILPMIRYETQTDI